MRKISQVELVTYINEIDEKLNNKKYRDILYAQYLSSDQRKTKADKRYKVITGLIKNNYDAQVGETTVWRVLKIKNYSRKMFNEILSGEKGIKSAYNELFGVNEKSETKCEEAKLNVPSINNIEQNLIEIEKILKENKDLFSNKKELLKIDSQLFKLRKAVNEVILYHEKEDY